MKIERKYILLTVWKTIYKSYKRKRKNEGWRLEYSSKIIYIRLKYFVIIKLNSIINPCRSLIRNHNIIVTLRSCTVTVNVHFIPNKYKGVWVRVRMRVRPTVWVQRNIDTVSEFQEVLNKGINPKKLCSGMPTYICYQLIFFFLIKKWVKNKRQNWHHQVSRSHWSSWYKPMSKTKVYL
jgi:hypothetical protein